LAVHELRDIQGNISQSTLRPNRIKQHSLRKGQGSQPPLARKFPSTRLIRNYVSYARVERVQSGVNASAKRQAPPITAAVTLAHDRRARKDAPATSQRPPK
jgi:hypothetical protein